MVTRNPQKTRERILTAAFQEVHARGFQGMRVDEVLRRSGLQKGAFYHHFGSKTELGYAVLEEQVRPLVESLWIEPLSRIRNPARELPQLLEDFGERVPPAMREHGCPLNNLAQEMASQDEGFRERIAWLLEHWIDALRTTLDRAKTDGHIRDDVDSHSVARFLIAALEGCIGVFKVERSQTQWAACRTQIAAYLDGLRPRRD